MAMTRGDLFRRAAAAVAVVAAPKLLLPDRPAAAAVAPTPSRVGDAARLQKLIDDAHRAGKVAVIPPGRYVLERGLHARGRVVITGSDFRAGHGFKPGPMIHRNANVRITDCVFTGSPSVTSAILFV